MIFLRSASSGALKTRQQPIHRCCMMFRDVGPAALVALGTVLVDVPIAAGQAFPSSGPPNPAMTGGAAREPASPRAARLAPAPAAPTAAPSVAKPAAAREPAASPSAGSPPASAPRAVTVARTTEIPDCAVFVDAASGGGNGTAQRPHKTIAAAIEAARPGAVICVAEGTYAETLAPDEKHFTLAGGFQRGTGFSVRDSARYVTRAKGNGRGSFIRIEDPGPKGNQRTVIDGFDISGYSQAIVRDFHEPQRFDITNNHIHDNTCADDKLVGAGFALSNVFGRIAGNVIRNNSCGRGGAGALNETDQQNGMVIERNLIDGNAGTEPDTSHGGALYLFGKNIRVIANLVTNNSVTKWGAGIYVGAWTDGNQQTKAMLAWNVYRGNSAGVAGGGFFCDDGAVCSSFHEVYDRNCGGNIYLDSGTASGPTVAKFVHLTNVGALDVGCKAPGPGVRIDRGDKAPDTYSFVNAIFWDNAPGLDIAANCDAACGNVKVNVSYSMVQTEYGKNGLKVTFGDGILAPVDPLFAAPEQGDFHLQSAAGRWTPAGHVQDATTSPALGKGYSEGKAEDNPERAGNQIELGAYGNSPEASFAR